ncbi:hypothetical protein SVAN01_09049 [Stagonosporopsis vannaccii]|nr:hypothetical protein SVAN01_09049 [Stagonosporopsis vannaccii]
MSTNSDNYPTTSRNAPRPLFSHTPTPYIRATDYDRYPTTPSVKLMNLTNLLALGGVSRDEDMGERLGGVAEFDGREEEETRNGKEVEEENNGVDSGYSSRKCEATAGEHAGAGGEFDMNEQSDPMNGEGREWYDDQGFLIESTVDLALTRSRGSRRDRSDYPPRLKECFPTLISASSTALPPHTRQHPASHFRLRLPLTSHLPIQAPQVPHPRPRRYHHSPRPPARNDSQFSFDPRGVEKAVVGRRDIIDAEKERRQRQQVLGLETCDLVLGQEEARRVLRRETGFAHALGSTTARLLPSQDGRGAFVQRSAVGRGSAQRRRIGIPLLQHRTLAPSVHGWASNALPPNRALTEHVPAPTIDHSWDYVQYLSEQLHPLATTFGTAYERTVDAWIRGLGNTSHSEEAVSVGYCAQCSAVHVGRRAGALDSVVEGLWEEDTGRSDEGDGRSRVKEFWAGEGDAVAVDQESVDGAGWGRWCWPFRRGSCVSSVREARAGEEKDDRREDGRVRPWTWKGEVKVRRLCKRPLGATSVTK